MSFEIVIEQEAPRLSLIASICSSGYIFPLEQQGVYLFGKTRNDRAVCLVSRETNNGCLTREIASSIVSEIRQAGLKVPFLCFGYSSLYHDDLLTFVQIPWCFEEPDNPILRTIQTMNLQGKPHLLQ